ncbi:phage transcriptional regulator, AlpA [Psychromonas ingrahamii 37]|uniref:Phage transcriptional regulator, AlpA n=1 Tax=Psychromonas ingrahamii (strain DSM 17664 / CCUG 51855 / 37) TaxID=357804 RepID=A1SRJ4_PSYIN|nr:AlpA family phage regulatory protein [Psychromonas ingrahamii]ABM02109.1 phage transcriptional regulator, AlpA [Psychromonas ingrahamii 37]
MKFIRIKEVLNRTGLSRSVLYAKVAAQTFPQSFTLSGSTVAWLESEIEEWIESRIQERDQRVKINSKGGV